MKTTLRVLAALFVLVQVVLLVMFPSLMQVVWLVITFFAGLITFGATSDL